MSISSTQTNLDRASLPQRFSQFLAKQLFNETDLKAYFAPFIRLVVPQWQAQGHRCEVLSNLKLNPQTITLTLKPNRQWPGFKAGQYVDISVEINGARLTRTFSISSSPQQFKEEGSIELTIGVKDGGNVTPWLQRSLQSGHFLYISEAKGDFVVQDHHSPLLLIAGGTGITPLHAIVQDQADKEPEQAITLLYFARQFLLIRELERLQNRYPQVTVHLIDTSQKGHLHREQLTMLCPNLHQHHAMICGPHSLIKSAKSILTEMQVSDIQYEYFGAEPLEYAVAQGATHIRFTRSNITTESTQTNNLLDLAEASGLTPQHGCRRGVCHQCICQKTQGVVFNTVTQRYSDNGPQEIQLCVSVPATDVTLNL